MTKSPDVKKPGFRQNLSRVVRSALLGSATGAALVGVAYADTIVTYNFTAVNWSINNGTTYEEDGGTVSGTLVFNWTTNSIVSATIVSTASSDGTSYADQTFTTSDFSSSVYQGTYSGATYTFNSTTFETGVAFDEISATAGGQTIFIDFIETDTVDIFPGLLNNVYTTDNGGSYQRVLASTVLVSTPSSSPIDTNASAYLSSDLGSTVTPDFEGGTLQVDSSGTISNDFNVEDYSGNTIDPHGYTANFTGSLTGAGGLDINDQAGGGTVIFSNSGGNTYSGTTTVTNGTLQAGANNAFSPDSDVSMANSANAVLDLNNYNETIHGLSGGGSSGGNVLLGSGNLTISDGGSYGGEISGTGAVTLSGGTQYFTGTNDYTGGTTISGGTLYIGDGGTTGSIVGNVVDNSALAFDHSDSITFSGVISGSGSLAQVGTGTTVLTGSNLYIGGTTISSGTLQIGDGSTTGSIVGNVADDGTLTFDRSDTITYSGVISGSGDLVQAGDGTLVLTGVNTATGTTTVSGGTLMVGDAAHSGAVLNSSIGGVIVDTGATLAGHGTIVGAVTNSSGGTVSPGGSIGTLTVGSYTQGPTGTFSVEVSPTDASLLDVIGAASLDGTVNVDFDPGTYSAHIYQILTANPVSGTFSTFTNTGAPSNTVYGIYYAPSNTEVDLVITPTSAGQMFGDLATVGLDDAQSMNDMLLQHMNSESCGSEQKLPGQTESRLTCPRVSMWLQSFANSGRTGEAGGGVNAFNTHKSGMIGGLDYNWGEGASAGVAFGYNHALMSVADASMRSTTEGYFFAADTHLTAGAAIFDLDGFYMVNSTDASRDTGFSGTATSHPDSDIAGGALQVGFPMAGGDFVPFARLAYAHDSQKATSETGGGALDFAVSDNTLSSLRAAAGFRLSHAYESSEGTVWTPEMRLALDEELASVDRGTPMSLAGVSGTNFTAPAVSPERAAVLAGFSLTARWQDSLEFSLGAQGRASGNQTQGTVNAGLRLFF